MITTSYVYYNPITIAYQAQLAGVCPHTPVANQGAYHASTQQHDVSVSAQLYIAPYHLLIHAFVLINSIGNSCGVNISSYNLHKGKCMAFFRVHQTWGANFDCTLYSMHVLQHGTQIYAWQIRQLGDGMGICCTLLMCCSCH